MHKNTPKYYQKKKIISDFEKQYETKAMTFVKNPKNKNVQKDLKCVKYPNMCNHVYNLY